MDLSEIEKGGYPYFMIKEIILICWLLHEKVLLW
jgi:glucosamine 6-phosphate synthetase-like amidotransferase/phosphosugar isomerase protein